MARRPQPRRGILLLIVLSLLVLFVLIGLTFIVSASQFERITASDSRTGQTGMPGNKIADASMYQFLRGSGNPYSLVRGHSLLEDLYGRDYFVGKVDSAVEDWLSDHQFQQMGFQFVRSGKVPTEVAFNKEFGDDYYGGCVLTFITGRAKGKSTRIVQYRNNSSERWLRFEGVMMPNPNTGNLEPGPGANDLFIVNGRPFNGTGAGFSAPPFVPPREVTWRLDNSVAFSSDSVNARIPLALIPNYTAYREVKSLEEISFGGLDESWDAVDYQNVFLAKVPATVENDADIGLGDTESGTYLANTGGITPSFHRPYLLAYIQQHYPKVLVNPDFRRTFLFRPDREDHPAFTGSNPTYDPLVGPWDVDNDGDRIPDSIWMDVGHDPIAGPDGKLYKPLVAPLIIDLDGRRNLNAAGNLEHSKALANSEFAPAGNALGLADGNNIILPASPNPLGLGFGPADIALPTHLQRLLRSRYQGVGETILDVDLAATPPAQEKEQATPGNGPPVVNGPIALLDSDDDDPVKGQRLPGNVVPNIYFRGDQNLWVNGQQGSLDTGFGSPVDLFGRSLPLLDPTGNMIWANLGLYDGLDDPYEAEPLRRTPNDNLFTFSDLEVLLRFDDHRTPSRFRDVALTFRQFTTHSVHIPAPPTLNAGNWRHEIINDADNDSIPDNVPGEGLRRSIRQMFAGKFFRSLATAFPGVDRQVLEDQTTVLMKNQPDLVPRELARGEKVDINQALRPNLPIHTPQEYLNIIIEKGRFARDLFHLLMLFTEQDFELPSSDSTLTPEQKRELHVRRLAQWSINVVDFADADSVMTLFEYDKDPFNAVPVDGNPFTDDPDGDDVRIWGCEHPELLLTETLAFHDRRVKDMGVGGMRKENGQEKDDDLDQPVPPQGSLFVELYCARGGSPARSGANPRLVSSRGPEDMYTTPGTVYQPRLNLGQMAGNSPVWRLAIGERQSLGSNAEEGPLKLRNSKPEETSFEPENLSLISSSTPLRLNRFIWFANVEPNGVAGAQVHNTYFNQAGTPGDPVLVSPGTYVVVGPRLVTNIGLAKTHLDDPVMSDTEKGNGQDGPTSDQRIDLSNLLFTNADNVSLRAQRPSRATAIIAQTLNSKAGCSISEPTDDLSYYPAPDPATGRYISAIDTPLDLKSATTDPATLPSEQLPLADTNGDDNETNLQLTGTRLDHRTIFLQRLVNPSLPWNAAINPYVTVDWMPIDLTVFNSLDEAPSQPQEPADKPFDPLDDPDLEIPGAELGFFNLASREKAGANLNVWSAKTEPGKSTAAAAANLTKSARTNVPHTLGWLNSTFGAFIPPGPGTTSPPAAPNDYAEAPSTLDPETGSPSTFPTLVWNNRPYANIYELMLVPACSQARLTQEFTASRDESPIAAKTASDEDKQDAYLGAFGHLLNFFHSSPGTLDESLSGTPSQAANYFRIFDFVTVPSRFRGTTSWYNTTTLAPANPFAADPSLSKLREPGRVNANTMFNGATWRAVGFWCQRQ